MCVNARVCVFVYARVYMAHLELLSRGYIEVMSYPVRAVTLPHNEQLMFQALR